MNPMAPLLLIDDDPIHLATLASTVRLKLPQAEVDTMESALSSLERVRSREYGAILCDGQQAGIEGVAFARAVRKLQPQTPVLLLIEKEDQDLIKQAMEAGAYDVLVRPVEAHPLLFALQRAMEAYRLRSWVQRERAQLLATLDRLLKDLECLYGADGLSAHFAAFLDQVNQDRHTSGKNHGSSGPAANGGKGQA